MRSGPDSVQQEAYIVDSLERLGRLQNELERLLVNVRQQRRREEVQNRHVTRVCVATETNSTVDTLEDWEPISFADDRLFETEECLDGAAMKENEKEGHNNNVRDFLGVFAVKDTIFRNL